MKPDPFELALYIRRVEEFVAKKAEINEIPLPIHLSIGQELMSVAIILGLSDHTPGIGAAVAAISYGATIIEKHFTLDKNAGGFDDIFSMDPDEFKLLVDETKNAWLSLGKVCYSLSKDEKRHKMFNRFSFAYIILINLNNFFTMS